MKKIINGIVIFAVTLLAPHIVQAQGTTYLSSLSPTSTSSLPVGERLLARGGIWNGKQCQRLFAQFRSIGDG
jgi:hypothetical protein